MSVGASMLVVAFAAMSDLKRPDFDAHEADVPVTAESKPRTLNIYVAPLPVVSLGVIGLLNREAFVYLPTGFTVALGPNWGISGELSGLFIHDGGTRSGWGVSASLGPTWLPSRNGVDGWFISPKLTFDAAQIPPFILAKSSNNGPVDFGPGVERSYFVGLDAGYTIATGKVSFAFALGASVGYGYDAGNGFISPLTTTTPASAPARTQGFVWSLNLSLVRVGIAR